MAKGFSLGRGDDFSAEDLSPKKKKSSSKVEKCARCQTPFEEGVSSVTIKNRKYCPTCAGYLLRAIEAEGAAPVGVSPSSRPETAVDITDENAFYDAVKQAFEIEEIPVWWKRQMETFLKEDDRRNYKALSYTLWYVLSIKCITLEEKYGLAFVRNFYQEASEYYKKRKAVLEKNKSVDITPTTETVTIAMPPEGGYRPKTKIEDL